MLRPFFRRLAASVGQSNDHRGRSALAPQNSAHLATSDWSGPSTALRARGALPTTLLLGWALVLAGCLSTAIADPLSKKIDLDFFREIPSRNLRGLATRSDGRMVAGPVLSELTGSLPADLLWCLTPSSENQWLIGTGPDGRIFEATLDAAKNSFTAREVAKLDDPQVFALRRLSDGSILAGTSPRGGLVLIREGKVVARVSLPVDSIFDLLVLSNPEPETPNAKLPATLAPVLIATGNPGRIYQVSPTVFAAAGIAADKVTDPKILAEKGITLFGEIRDRNVRRLARVGDAIVAGSSPRGNIYRFSPRAKNSPAAGPVAPVILQENRDAEVTDILPQPNGDFYAAVVFTTVGGDARINTGPKPKDGAKDAPDPSAVALFSALAVQDRFTGRSALLYFPAGGFPETLTARNNVAFYQIVRHGDTLVAAGGEQGELAGYDLGSRFALTFAGSTSAQINALAAVAGTPGRFLALRNNPAGLASLDFASTGERSAESRRFDLSTPATFGALRFTRLRNLSADQITVEIKTSFGTDEVEGWTAWTALAPGDPGDPSWRGSDLRGRYAKLRLKILASAAANAPVELDKAELYFLPQNRRPLLQEFRLLAPNVAVVPASEPTPSVSTSLSQILANSGVEDSSSKRTRSNFMSSQVVPSPGTQAALWTLTDPDGDNLAATFSIRRENETTWTDLVVGTRDPYVQFETARWPDGVYFTRLVATELAPRAAADRLSVTFETDNLIIDHTPPVILAATAAPSAQRMVINVHGRDALSLLDSIEVVFNNGYRETLEHPVDGIRDGREESFNLEVPIGKVTGATAAEVTLYDSIGNATTRRVTW